MMEGKTFQTEEQVEQWYGNYFDESMITEGDKSLIEAYTRVESFNEKIRKSRELPEDLKKMDERLTQLVNYNELNEAIILEGKYGLPEGRLYIAYSNDKLAGCIGLKKVDKINCEMKRLYVRPQFRGQNIGIHFIQQIIDDAREIGYKFMLLDTLPFLESAIHMYKKSGFYEVESYNDSPMESSIYMKLDL